MSITRLPGGVEAAGVALPQWTTMVHWNATDPGFQPIFIATIPCVVVEVIGRLIVAEGSLAELDIERLPNGSDVGTGTLVNNGAFDANGTPLANQSLALASLAARTLADGDALVVQTAGDWTASIGCVQVTLQARDISQ